MKKKLIILLSVMLLLFSFTACTENKASIENTYAYSEQSEKVDDSSSDLSENKSERNSPQYEKSKDNNTENSQNSAYAPSHGEHASAAEAPPTPSAKETDEDTTAADIVSEDSDGWINKWY